MNNLDSKEIAMAVKEHIDNSYNDPKLSISAISEMFNYSSGHLTILFRKEYGITVHRYIFECRKQQIIEMLKENYPIKRIAEEAGFVSIRTFNRIFKKEFGVSPTEYKNELFFNK